MITLYLPGKSWLHRIPAGVKLIALCLISMALLSLQTIPLVMAAAVIIFGLYLSLGAQGLRQLKALRPVGLLLAVIFLFHLFTGNWQKGVLICLHLLSMVALANLVTVTTRLDEMMDAVKPLFKPLEWVGVPAAVPALAVALVIRFTPELLRVHGALSEAMRARTGKGASFRLLAPLLLQSLAMSEKVAEALTARGGARGLTSREKTGH